MKKSLAMLLILSALSLPAIKHIDSYTSESNYKLLVIDESVNTFHTSSFYSIEC